MLNEDDWETLQNVEVVKEEFSTYCVRILNRLFEELPLERWVADAAERGEVSPNILKDLFGKGEGRGWDEVNGLTIEEALRCWYTTDQVIDKIIQEAKERDDADLSQSQVKW